MCCFGVVVLSVSPFLAYVRGPALLSRLGITPVGVATLDYEPLIPWFGVLLIGIALGSVLYRGCVRCKVLEKLGEMPKVASPLAFLGRHSLLIYLIHNPIIFAVLWISVVIPW